MAKGHPPKPTALKIVQNNPGKRAMDIEDEPTPNTGIPDLPPGLSRVARTAWDRLAPLLDGMSVLTQVDGAALERMCESYAEIIRYQDLIDRDGATYMTTNEHGEMLIKGNPAVAMLGAADRRFKSYLTEFGLTPAARTKVKVTGGKKKDPLDGYF